MKNATRVRVEQRFNSQSGNYEDRWQNFKRLHAAFKRACDDSGVLRTCRQHATYESPSRRRRRKDKEAERLRLRTELKDSGVRKKKKKNSFKKDFS